MNEIKYVIVIPRGMNKNGARAILFNGMINHKDMVQTILATKEFVLHSAGFCTVFPEIKAWGRSESLEVGSRKDDAEVINRTLRHNHTVTDMIGRG